MKITIQDIIKWSKPRPGDMGRQTKLENNDCILSIVGGCKGLYGDFENTFELAVIYKKNNSFITNVFIPSLQDDVAAYLTVEEVERVLELFSKKNFQVL